VIQHEYKLCVAIRAVLDAYRVMYTKIVNEQPDGQRAAMEARVGKLAGMPDYLVFGRSSTDPNLAIEVKAGKGRLGTRQPKVLADLACRGWQVHVVRSLDELVKILDDAYGRPT
jgi:hypothetical protein